jgi:hypothetical protein
MASEAVNSSNAVAVAGVVAITVAAEVIIRRSGIEIVEQEMGYPGYPGC